MRLNGHRVGRRRRRAALVFAGFVLGMAFAVTGLGQAIPGDYRADRILVKPKAHEGRAVIAGLHAGMRSRVLRTFHSLDGIQLIGLPAGTRVEDALARYQGSGLVEFAEPDYWVRPTATPNDPKYADGTLWGLNNTGRSGGVPGADISAANGWDAASSAGNVIVAVVDTGIRYTHEDLSSNMWINPGELGGNGIDDDANGYIDDVHGIDAIDNTGNPNDDTGHGTHVAGIIGAAGNNSVGVVGVAWKVKLMACRFMDASGMGSHADAVQCIDYARVHGAQVINASWGGGSSSLTLRSAISRARSAGIIFVAAAGNEGQNDDVTGNYPSGFDLDNIISVGSSTRSDGLSDFSNFGLRTVDLVAPGTAIYSTWHSSDRSYTFNSGTSMAAPYVAGAAALLRARFPADSHFQIINRLYAATDPLPPLAEKCSTGGRLNLERALAGGLLANFSASRWSGAPPLSVTFQSTSIGSIAQYHWDFGDKTTSQEAAPAHVFTGPGNYAVTLTVTGPDGQTSSRSRTVAVQGNYQIIRGVYDWVDPTGMNRVTLTDNGVSSARVLPFPFVFYGESYDRLYIGANGIIGFNPLGLETSSNANMPNAANPNAIIGPYWDNLNPASRGTVYYGVVGQEPNRRAVISWVGVPRNSTPTATLTFQAILEEESNQIIFHYSEVQPKTSRGGAKGATVGIENHTGTAAAKYTFDGSPSVLTNEQALLFLPPNQGGLLVSPSGGFAMGGPANGPFTPNSTVYTVENRSVAAVRWSASSTQPWVSVGPTNGVLNPGQRAAVIVSLSEAANLLKPGSYSDTLVIANSDSGSGNMTRRITLDVDGTMGILTIAPESHFWASGPEGGPFNPASQVYTLVNAGDARIDWTVGVNVPWVTISPSSGTLSPEGMTTVSVLINESAGSLPAGKHSDFIFFANATTGQGTDVREVTLEVTAAGQAQLEVSAAEADGSFRFVLTGEPGRQYVIESSLDLVNWTAIATMIVEADGRFEFVEPDSEHSVQKFYRAVLQ